MYKRRKIKDRLNSLERDLANAKAYLERGVNVEGFAWLHTDDWQGKSGHPLWIENHMIRALKRRRVKEENALQTLNNKRRERLKDHGRCHSLRTTTRRR